MNKKKITKLVYSAMTATVVTLSSFMIGPTTTNANEIFTDVKEADYYYDAVMNLATNGYVTGFPDNTYKPNASITRGQMAIILAGLLELDTDNVTNPQFTDVSTSHPYYGAIAAMHNAGYINGFEDGSYGINKPITRYHMALILSAAFNLTATNVDALPFTDVYPSYKETVAALFEHQVTAGRTPTTFDGSKNVTRGQMAVFLVKAIEATYPYLQVINVEGDKVITTNGEYTFDESLAGVFSAENRDALSNSEMIVNVAGTEIKGISVLILNNGGTVENPITFNGDNIDIVGEVYVNADYIKIQNVSIAGDLCITNNVFNQLELVDVYLDGEMLFESEEVPEVLIFYTE
nr:S-layer homology domain-containing protein [Lysinibacillus timonensis]